MLINELDSNKAGRMRLYKEYNMTTETVAQDVILIKDWIHKQPHFPKSVPLDLDLWLENMLLLTKNSVERVKKSVDLYISAREANPNIFTARDPRVPEMVSNFENMNMILLPGLTDEGHRVIIMKPNTADTDFYDLVSIIKRSIMFADYYLKNGVDFTGMQIIHDLEHFRLGHLTKFNLQTMRMMAATMKAYPVRIPKISVINTPPFIDKAIAIIRPFLSAKLMSRIKTYKDGSQMLDILPSKMVPKDYGGEAPSNKELNDMWRERMIECSEYYATCDSVKTDESKRLGQRLFSVTDFGENGSFRQLSVD